MQKRGLEATGILANVCKTAGFGSVSDLLQKNPTAKRAILDVPKQEVCFFCCFKFKFLYFFLRLTILRYREHLVSGPQILAEID